MKKANEDRRPNSFHSWWMRYLYISKNSKEKSREKYKPTPLFCVTHNCLILWKFRGHLTNELPRRKRWGIYPKRKIC
jgi:hypothetical protein